MNTDFTYLRTHKLQINVFAVRPLWVLFVVPTVVVHPGAEQFNGWLCPVFFFGRHVQIIHKNDCRRSGKKKNLKQTNEIQVNTFEHI